MAYQKVLKEISRGTGVLTMIPNIQAQDNSKPKKKRRPRAADDIIEAIISIITERELANYQRIKQAIAQSEQLKIALKTLEALICTLVAAISKDEQGMTARQTHAAAPLRDVLDTMKTTNWCRMELKETIEKHIQKADERDR